MYAGNWLTGKQLHSKGPVGPDGLSGLQTSTGNTTSVPSLGWLRPLEWVPLETFSLPLPSLDASFSTLCLLKLWCFWGRNRADRGLEL